MRTEAESQPLSVPPPPKVRVLGSPVSPIDLQGTLRLARRAVERSEPLRIAVTNANKLWLANGDSHLADYLESAEVVVPETATVWAARRLGISGVHPVWGVALMAALLDEADANAWTVYLLGARHPVLTTLCRRIGERWPGARIVGSHHGYFEGGDRERVQKEIRDLRPNLLLVAMGSPLQEHFLAELHAEPVPIVSLGVGGSFDVHAGLKKDAPGWIRGSGFEWLYRALLSPRLFRRYLVVNPWFVGSVFREMLAGPRRGPNE